MLERTARCLDHGGRNAWRPHLLALRSRRTLHSTFWRHGAGDLELPSWYYSIIQSRLFDSSKCVLNGGGNGEGAGADNTFASGPVILDFLYPEKTIAVIKKLSKYGMKRLQRRLAPQAPTAWQRKYVSVATHPERTRNDISLNFLDQYETKDTGVPAVLRPSRKNVTGLEQLLGSEYRDRYSQAWDLAHPLNKSMLTPELEIKLLEYLSTSSRQLEADRVYDLFSGLHASLRSTCHYSTVIQLQARAGRFGRAVSLHSEAVLAGAFKLSIASGLLSNLVLSKHWQLAFEVYETCTRFAPRYRSDENGQHDWEGWHRDLWQETRQLGNAFSRALDLISTSGNFFGISSTSPSAKRKFILGLVRSALESSAGKRLNHLIKMLKQLREMGLSANWIYEGMLHAIITPAANSPLSKERLASKAVKIYQVYREDECFRPHKAVLHELLKFFGVFSDRSMFYTLVSDWQQYHGVPESGALNVMMTGFARLGDAEGVHRLFDGYVKEFGSPTVQLFCHVLHVHALRLEIQKVTDEFNRMQTDFNLKPNISCWNTRILAHSRVDDLDQCLECMSLLLESDLKPDRFTIVPILGVAARKGKISTIKELLQVADSNGIRQDATMMPPLVQAYIEHEQLENAERTVHEALQRSLPGSQTRMWNLLLLAYAVRGDTQNFMRIYSNMKSLEVPFDSITYSAILRMLVVQRQVQNAYHVLFNIMPKNQVPRQGVHYATVLEGFVKSGDFKTVRHILQKMEKYNVEMTFNTELVKLAVLAFEDRQRSKDNRFEHPGLRFTAAEAKLEDIISNLDPGVLSRKEPVINRRGMNLGEAFPGLYFNLLIKLYGSQRSYDVMEQLILKYSNLPISRQPGEDPVLPPMSTIGIMMKSHLERENHQEVRRYWDIAVKVVRRNFGELKSHEMSLAHRHAFSKPLDVYMRSLMTQSRGPVQLRTFVKKHMEAGFELDNDNWNTYVRLLAGAIGRPVDLSRLEEALSVCEVELMREWPGWISSEQGRFKSLRSVRSPGLEYIDLKFLAPGQRVAKYKTIKMLATAVASFEQRALRVAEYKRDLQIIRKKAPRTIGALETLPSDPRQTIDALPGGAVYRRRIQR